MQGITISGNRQVYYSMGAQVARYGVWAQAEGLVGLFDVECVAVCIRIDSDRLDIHFGTRSYDANSDFTTIGYQDLFDQELTQSK